MIQPLKLNSNIHFGSGEEQNFAVFNQTPAASFDEQNATQDIISETNDEFVKPQIQEDTKAPKLPLGKRLINTLKSFNIFKDTAFGAAKGVVGGTCAFIVTSVAGKKAKEAQGKILGTLGGLAKSFGSTVVQCAKAVPALITKSPLENAKNFLSVPYEFCKRNLTTVTKQTVQEAGETIVKESRKLDKATALVASVAGLSVLALKTIQGRIKGNVNNSNIDHNLYWNHTKNKKA